MLEELQKQEENTLECIVRLQEEKKRMGNEYCLLYLQK